MKIGFKFLALALAAVMALSFTSCNMVIDIVKEVADVAKDMVEDVLDKDEVVIECGSVQVDDKMMGFFFNDTINNWYDSYGVYANYFSVNFNEDLKEQQFGASTYDTAILGQFSGSWYDYFMEMTLYSVETTVVFADYANQRGIVLNEEDNRNVDAYLETIAYKLDNVGASYEDWYGRGVDEEDVRRCFELMELSQKASDYLYENIENSITESEMSSWYDRNNEDDEYDESLTHNLLMITTEDKNIAEDLLRKLKSEDIDDADDIIAILNQGNFGDAAGYSVYENALAGVFSSDELDNWVESEDRVEGDLSDIVTFKSSSSNIKYFQGATTVIPKTEIETDYTYENKYNKNEEDDNSDKDDEETKDDKAEESSENKVIFDGSQISNGGIKFEYNAVLGENMTIGGVSSFTTDIYVFVYFEGHGEETWKVVARDGLASEKFEDWINQHKTISRHNLGETEFSGGYITSYSSLGGIFTYNPSVDGSYTIITTTPFGSEE